MCGDDKALGEVGGEVNDFAGLLAGREVVGGDTADGTFFYIKDTD